MQIKLNEQDLDKIIGMIQKIPFELAFPIFQFINQKITEEMKNEKTTNTK